MPAEIAAIVAQTELFDNLTDHQLNLIAAICEPVALGNGEVLFQENDSSSELFIITRGRIEILVNPGLVGLDRGLPPIRLAELREGQVVGELSLVDQGLRSATARATAASTLLAIERRRLILLCETYPRLGYILMQNLAVDLALKMRHTDLTVRQLQLLLATADRTREA